MMGAELHSPELGFLYLISPELGSAGFVVLYVYR
jgi:hypothetical protein